MANKLRHIAISVRDPEATAKFFEQAFGMTRAGNAQRGVYMTDGIMNVALLNFGDEPIAGFEGQKDVTGLKETNPNVYYEVKYRTPEGIIFDVTESGWKGAVKDVTPSPKAA